MHYTLTGPESMQATFAIIDGDSNSILFFRSDKPEPTVQSNFITPFYIISVETTPFLQGKPFCPVKIGNCPKDDQFMEILSLCEGKDARIVEFFITPNDDFNHVKDIILNHPQIKKGKMTHCATGDNFIISSTDVGSDSTNSYTRSILRDNTYQSMYLADYGIDKLVA